MKSYIIPILFFLLLVNFTAFSQEDSKKYQLKIRIFDNESSKNLDKTKVYLYNLTLKKSVDSALVEDGYVTFMLDKGYDYDIIGKRKSYLTKRANFDASCYKKDPQKIFCVAGIVINNVTSQPDGTDLIDGGLALKKIAINTVFKIENIYYDLNKWFIRPEAAVELDKLVVILKDNPDITVELGSHTDCRASDAYNNDLSQKRAESAVAYIISKGIPSDKITAKGYGETVLINRCKDGVKCTETEHQANRRTEVKITGISSDGENIDIKGGNK